MGRPELIDSSIRFNGKNNVLFCDKNVVLRNSALSFLGNNAVIYLSTNDICVNLDLSHDSVIYFGKGIYTNSKLAIMATERKHVCIGDDGLFSHRIKMRTADPHLLYDAKSYVRINDSRSIFIGDHVWIGQEATILKGSQIGSGSVIGTNAVVANKTLYSNHCYAGNPVRVIKKNIFFTRHSVHNYTEQQTQKSHNRRTDAFTYQNDPRFKGYFAHIDAALSSAATAQERLAVIREKLVSCVEKNRFAVLPDTVTARIFHKFLRQFR